MNKATVSGVLVDGLFAYYDQIMSFFFEAMTKGWAAGGKKIKIPQLPGYKAIEYGKGECYLLDCYCVTPYSSKSAGFTTIYLRNIPIWVMHYGGAYDKTVMPFLKSLLLETYQKKEFRGGRGPGAFLKGSFYYRNEMNRDDFTIFSGREEIHNKDTGKLLGYHNFSGMILLEME